MSIGASVLTIMFLSVDRYFAIRHPVDSRARITTVGHVTAAIALIWTVSGAIMVPLAVTRSLEEYALPAAGGFDSSAVAAVAAATGDGPDPPAPAVVMTLAFCHEKWPTRRARHVFDVFLFLFIYVVPGTTVGVSYALTGCRLIRGDRDLVDGGNGGGGSAGDGADQRRSGATGELRQHGGSNVSSSTDGGYARVLAGRRRVARMLLVMAIAFAVSWLPYHAVSLYVDFVNKADVDEVSLAALSFALFLGHTHSAQNPILYCIMNRSFKRSVSAVLMCRGRVQRGIINSTTASCDQRNHQVWNRLPV